MNLSSRSDFVALTSWQSAILSRLFRVNYLEIAFLKVMLLMIKNIFNKNKIFKARFLGGVRSQVAVSTDQLEFKRMVPVDARPPSASVLPECPYAAGPWSRGTG